MILARLGDLRNSARFGYPSSAGPPLLQRSLSTLARPHRVLCLFGNCGAGRSTSSVIELVTTFSGEKNWSIIARTPMLGRSLALSCISFFLIDYAAAQDSTAPVSEQSTTSERFQYYFGPTYSWRQMSWLAMDTGIDHLLHESEWGRGIDGYGCHYASGFGRRLVNNSIEL